MIPRVSFAFCWVMLGLVLVFLFAPIIIVVAVSFTESAIFSFPPQGFSLKWYYSIRNADGLLASAWLSAQVAFISTLISLVLGTLCTIAVVRRMVPGGDAYTTLLIAHIVLTMPFIMRTVLASLLMFDFSMVDAARMLGCSYPRALWRVLVPNILPGVMSGALFAFIPRSTTIPSRSFWSMCTRRRCPFSS